MRLGSVRVRLTALVVAITAAVVVLAATAGTSRVERSLIDDVVDEAAFEQIGFVEDLVLVDGLVGGVVIDGGIFDGPFAEELPVDPVPFEVPFVVDEVGFLESALADLDEVEALDPLLAAASADRSSGLPVLTNFGALVRVGVDGAESVVAATAPDSSDGPVVAGVTLEVLTSALFEPEVEEVLRRGRSADELFEDFDLEPGDVEFVFAVREAGELAFVVGAEVTDVRRSVDRIRDLVWASAPILVVGAALVTWLLTGRALRPVDHMTERVGVISAGRLDERVPEPGTGDEVDRLAATLNEMLDRLETDDRRLRRFVSDASHELRSPVAVLRSEAEVALRCPDDTDVDRLAGDVLAESERLQGIVEDLLVLARGDERQGATEFVVVDLDDVVLAEAARRRRVPVETSGVSAGRVRATAEIGRRIVAHLLDNAARHATGRVVVGLRRTGDTVELCVDDDGPGVPPEERARVFERFTRLEEARTRDRGGAGLGLAVVAESVGALGGAVACRDSPLGGARFLVSLPSAADGDQLTD